ncbi:MAG: acetate/propionate family kinase, partial [Gemmataceae bacterium]
LVFNPGSSTLKFRLVGLHGAEMTKLMEGTADHVAGDGVVNVAREILAFCPPVEAIGVRVVHGGERFTAPTRVTAEVRAAVRELGRLAPLHNPVAADLLDAIEENRPGVPVVAVFDTAFHRTMPDVAALDALPEEWTRGKGLRRYGMHGTSHEYVAGRLAERTGGTRLIVCHLGNGASVTAVKDGKSVETSMGLTPLPGLIMGTRCGDIGADVVLHLIRREGLSAERVEELLTRESGLLGLGGSADVRELLARDDEKARFALEAFAYRLRKYIGAYAAVLEGVDAIAFTGGIGENAAAVRAMTCEPLGWLGLRLDAGRNAADGAGERPITADGSAVAGWVIPTDEEAAIARHTAAVLA